MKEFTQFDPIMAANFAVHIKGFANKVGMYSVDKNNNVDVQEITKKAMESKKRAVSVFSFGEFFHVAGMEFSSYRVRSEEDVKNSYFSVYKKKPKKLPFVIDLEHDLPFNGGTVIHTMVIDMPDVYWLSGEKFTGFISEAHTGIIDGIIS